MQSSTEKKIWEKQREYSPEQMALAHQVLCEIREGRSVSDAVRRHPFPSGGYIPKHLLVATYRNLVKKQEWDEDPSLLAKIRMKPIRTLSGVTTVTVLTKPYPCPGKCIFCPTDIRMPKSYLPDEPGAMRAFQHNFDPFKQVSVRIEALESVGHPTDKIELLILGGTWDAYPKKYQEWFVKRCLDAMNGEESKTLEEAQRKNEKAVHRNVGMVVETRPDQVKWHQLAWLRKLGVTKVQVGAQSFDDNILELNKRGHDVATTKEAIAMLRSAGFKVVLHWMPNLLGATLQSDREDFLRIWEGVCPDEIKIYPTQLLENAELYSYWEKGHYQPYTTQELIDLIADIKETIPRYCRVNRIVRDIPSNHVVEGNKRTSLRQDIKREMERRGTQCQCIRCREVRGQKIEVEKLVFADIQYQAEDALEHFLSYNTPDDKLAGFLRLSLPENQQKIPELEELENAAIIREVHVYGQSIPVGREESGAAQHAGLGTLLIEKAEDIASKAGYQKLAVITAIGTRLYYLNRGFNRGRLYFVKDLN